VIVDCPHCTVSRRGLLRGALGTAVTLALGSRIGQAEAQGIEPVVEPLAHGHMDFSDFVDGPAEVYTYRITLPPGAIIPWHTHPGPVFGVINAGELTIYQDLVGCATTYGAGAAVFVPLGMTHEEHNEGAGPLELVATYVVPEGSPIRVPAQPPGGAACAS
jgi:quercetin dioxygenase-like cupin family protein